MRNSPDRSLHIDAYIPAEKKCHTNLVLVSDILSPICPGGRFNQGKKACCNHKSRAERSETFSDVVP
jgi:hypothetical protein